ncbi:MAG: hypothetical protein JSW71_16465 [Gemmatimonadota bacterium]|nr:MAG: hypothetical protein JSW71_16465 [Gemmatimonadota bacterium]
MQRSVSRRRVRLLLVVALALTLWAVAGFFQRLQYGYTGAIYSPNYVVEFVPPDGALDQAGFQAGDSVISVEGTPVERLGMYSRWPRSLNRRPGESLRLEVVRDGASVPLDLVYGELPRGIVSMRLGGMIVGLAFLWCGIWALLTTHTTSALALSRIGIAAALALSGPYLGSWDGVASHVAYASIVLWTALMLHFFITFPKPKRVGRSRVAVWLTFGPWILFIPLLVLELIFHPRFYHSIGGPGSLLMLVYTVLALAAAAHTAATTPRMELVQSGMGLILVGILVAVVSTLIWAIDSMFLRDFQIPGSSYFPLLILAIPVTMALGVRKQARRERLQ